MANYPNYYPQAGGYAQQPYYQQTYQPQYMQPQQTPMISGRPVSSKEEALSTPADYLSGSTVMTDFPHGTIYAKVVDKETGVAELQTFRRVRDEAPPAQESRMETLERKLDAILQMLQSVPSGKHVKEADGNV